MDPIEPISVAVEATTTVPAPPGIDIFSLIWSIFGNSEGTASFLNQNGFLNFFDVVWTIYAFLAFIVSGLMLALYAYASTRRWQFYAKSDADLRREEVLYDETYRGVRSSNRLDDVLTHIASPNPNDWKLAIIEADIILDDALKSLGYAGGSLGERLKSISTTQLSTLDEAWEAHKVRNRIAHEGADFVLTKRIAEDTINRYRRVFNELGV
ncbi:MAG: hypothetical protein AAB618_01000 [Patescibacteria group bacterium]